VASSRSTSWVGWSEGFEVFEPRGGRLWPKELAVVRRKVSGKTALARRD
jgi:hypothetical protein